jgi:hypothetical protein
LNRFSWFVALIDPSCFDGTGGIITLSPHEVGVDDADDDGYSGWCLVGELSVSYRTTWRWTGFANIPNISQNYSKVSPRSKDGGAVCVARPSRNRTKESHFDP